MMLVLGGCSSSSNYQPESKEPTVSTPTIGQSGTLRVGVNTDKSPLAGMGKEKIIGMDVDIAAAIADELGLKVSIVDVGSDPEAALSEGKVDIVMGIDSSDAISEFWLSDEYLPTGVALFALTSNGTSVPTTVADSSVAAQISSKSAWAVSNAFGEDALASTADLSTAFTQLESGKVKYVASDAIIGLYAAHREGLDTTIVSLLSKPSGYCVGVASSNTQLQTTVADVLDKLTSEGVVGVIEGKWLGQSLDLAPIPQIEITVQADESAGEEGSGQDSQDSDGNVDADAVRPSSSSAASSAGSSSSASSSSRTAA